MGGDRGACVKMLQPTDCGEPVCADLNFIPVMFPARSNAVGLLLIVGVRST
jgi:hypothetical protein